MLEALDPVPYPEEVDDFRASAGPIVIRPALTSVTKINDFILSPLVCEFSYGRQSLCALNSFRLAVFLTTIIEMKQLIFVDNNQS